MARNTVGGYREDLAYIHDAGFSGFSLSAAPGLLRILRRNGIRRGLVVDLGCGSGRWARELNLAGYDALGVDQSKAFVRLARKISPRARFVKASLLDFELPPCDAITSIGECLNYLFDPNAGRKVLPRLFARAHAALRPGGVFIFDAAGPRRIPSRPLKWWSEGPDWAILVETAGDRGAGTLAREMTCFRKLGTLYRRSTEAHRIQLYRPAELARQLARAGFSVRVVAGYGRFRLPVGIAGFIARKPPRASAPVRHR